MKKTVSVLLVLLLLFSVTGCTVLDLATGKRSLSGATEKQAVEAAEKYVKQQVYRELGVVPAKFSSTVIWTGKNNDSNRYIVAVKFYLSGSSNAGGSMAVYTGFEVIDSTQIMAPDEPYKENLEALKALFGV